MALPVVAQDVYVIPVPVGGKGGVAAADVVELQENELAPGDNEVLRRVDNDGDEQNRNFNVPSGRLLIVTAIHSVPLSAGNGLYSVELLQDDSSPREIRHAWFGRRDEILQLQFSPGMVFESGARLRVRAGSDSTSGARIKVIGYLVDAPS